MTRGILWRWALRRLRTILDAADEWVHGREVKLRDAATRSEQLAAVDPVASAVREKARRRAARPKLPRLRYDHGSWVQ
jgi:hypothetical protein